ncbi:hypothetical protein [Vibrio sp. D431a]|uniref:hypothetical protein n=1 Tax=Vibrio sp. D431a TaxID=2837388 RepID=UPI0025534936|nr:hypothetical protein [Vibrio sp. D431a]MDK9790032.1 hypothetical protein [Vibrio sp. D431a]
MAKQESLYNAMNSLFEYFSKPFIDDSYSSRKVRKVKNKLVLSTNELEVSKRLFIDDTLCKLLAHHHDYVDDRTFVDGLSSSVRAKLDTWTEGVGFQDEELPRSPIESVASFSQVELSRGNMFVGSAMSMCRDAVLVNNSVIHNGTIWAIEIGSVEHIASALNEAGVSSKVIQGFDVDSLSQSKIYFENLHDEFILEVLFGSLQTSLSKLGRCREEKNAYSEMMSALLRQLKSAEQGLDGFVRKVLSPDLYTFKNLLKAFEREELNENWGCKTKASDVIPLFSRIYGCDLTDLDSVPSGKMKEVTAALEDVKKLVSVLSRITSTNRSDCKFDAKEIMYSSGEHNIFVGEELAFLMAVYAKTCRVVYNLDFSGNVLDANLPSIFVESNKRKLDYYFTMPSVGRFGSPMNMFYCEHEEDSDTLLRDVPALYANSYIIVLDKINSVDRVSEYVLRRTFGYSPRNSDSLGVLEDYAKDLAERYKLFIVHA